MIIFSFAFLLSNPVFSKQVNKDEVARVAESFLEWTITNSLSKQIIRNIKIIEEFKNQKNQQVLGYIVNVRPKGFLVISSDTNMEPIIAYSFQHNWSSDTSSTNTLYHILLQDMRFRKQALNKFNIDVIEKINRKWQTEFQSLTFQQWPEPGTTRTGGWLETTWYQRSPYNDFCPVDPDQDEYLARSLVGCVAIGMAQIVNYHKCLGFANLDFDDEYTTRTRKIKIDADSSKCDFPSFESLNSLIESIKYKYENDSILTDTDKAALSFVCGILVRTDYTWNASGALTWDVPDVLTDKLGYFNAECRYFDNAYHTIIENMINGMPAQLTINRNHSGSKHSVVVDGYNTGDFFHLNFGNGEYSPDFIEDAWYHLPEGMPAGYNVVYDATVNIMPFASKSDTIIVSQAAIHFKPSGLGEISETQSVMMRNCCQTPVEIDYIVAPYGFLVGLTQDSFVDSIGHFVIQSGFQLKLNVKFIPNRIGNFKGYLIVSYSQGKKYVAIELSGYGISAGSTIINGGNVAGIWNKSGSPYFIFGNIFINEGERLGINYGTEVIFATPSEFRIGSNAQLIAKGTEIDSIYFRGVDAEKGWSGFSFISSGTDDTLSYCVITGANSLCSDYSTYGGAISCYFSSPKVTHSRIGKNSAYYGGALYLLDSAPIIQNTLICNNHAKFGGAVYGKNSSPHFVNVTISHNTATEQGGGISLKGNNNFVFKNSIVWTGQSHNIPTLSLENSDYLEFQYSDVDSTISNLIFLGDYPNEVRWAMDNISADPLFTDPDNSDFTLQSGSPCIDAGDPLDDVADEPLPHGYLINMGAFGGTSHAATTNNFFLTISPNPFDFGDIDPGLDKKELTLYLKNGCNGTIHITKISCTDLNHFSLLDFSGRDRTIEPASTLESGSIDSIRVIFALGQTFGEYFPASITIKSIEFPDHSIPVLAHVLLRFALIQNYP
ncbi:MAG: C10 family peptidase, partial [bacterium]